MEHKAVYNFFVKNFNLEDGQPIPEWLQEHYNFMLKPRHETNTIEGSVYKIINCVDDLIYVGSTSQSLAQRMAGHRLTAKKSKIFLYEHMRKIGIENFKICLLEKVYYKHNELWKLHVREQFWIEKLNTFKNGLNSTKACFLSTDKKPRTKEEFDNLCIEADTKKRLKKIKKKHRCICCNQSFNTKTIKKRHFKGTKKHHRNAVAYWKNRYSDVIDDLS